MLAHCRPDFRAAARGALGAGALLLAGLSAQAESFRFAVFHAPLSASGPGKLLQQIEKRESVPRLLAQQIAHLAPDVLLLTDFDWDLHLVAAQAFQRLMAQEGHELPHIFAFPPNAGMPSGLDLNGNGRLAEPEDAWGYGRFPGDGSMLLLSRVPLDAAAAQDYSQVLWRSNPEWPFPLTSEGGLFPNEAVAAQRRLSSNGHWVVRFVLEEGAAFSVMAWSASPPVFDGSEDENGKRNAAEQAFWGDFLAGAYGPVPERFVLMGHGNLDPHDGEGEHAAIRALLSHPGLQDPQPTSTGAAQAAEPAHSGPAEQDTADWPDGAPGNLRVSYVLPNAGAAVLESGVYWPASGKPAVGFDSDHDTGPHHLVWVDVKW